MKNRKSHRHKKTVFDSKYSIYDDTCKLTLYNPKSESPSPPRKFDFLVKIKSTGDERDIIFKAIDVSDSENVLYIKINSDSFSEVVRALQGEAIDKITCEGIKVSARLDQLAATMKEKHSLDLIKCLANGDDNLCASEGLYRSTVKSLAMIYMLTFHGGY